MERRTFFDGLKVEQRAEGGNMLVGYAAVFYRSGDVSTQYELRGDLVERVSPTAFQSLEGDVKGTWNHSELLGTLENGTLRISVDQRGLRYEIDLPDTTAGRDVATLVNRGDVRGSSFGFVAKKAPITREDGLNVRTLESVTLLDVGPVINPAYKGTTTGMRSENHEDALRELEEYQKNLRAKHQIQLRKHLH